MRGNAWQVTAIIAILLVIVLLIPLVLMGRGWKTLSDDAASAKKNQIETAQRAATLEREADSLKALIGKSDVNELNELLQQHAGILSGIRPGESDPTRTYHDTLIALIGNITIMQGEIQKAGEDRAKLQSEYNNAQENYRRLLDQEKANLRRVETDRNAERNEYLRTRETYSNEMAEVYAQQKLAQDRLERTRNELTDRVNQLEFSNKDISDTNTFLANLLEDVRNPNVEHPDGKIISVDQKSGTAIVNLGSADGLLVRTMFSVYHSSITGLSFRTTSEGRDAVYCDVCKREVSREVAKASVEVMRILGPHRAEVRILDDILTDPIMAGDVVYSPIWKPGQKLRFALGAGMRLPGSSLFSGTDGVKRLIESQGGIVDCWIDAMAGEGEEYLQGELLNLTNFVVIDDEASRGLEPGVALVQEGLLESARNRAIKIISLENLLSRMAWKNMTPVYVFGSEEFLPAEMRVSPIPQSSVRYSDNRVSPMFTPDNPNARINARDANTVRDSGGIVSPLFNDQAPPPPNSGGRTSDLFRTRSPQTE